MTSAPSSMPFITVATGVVSVVLGVGLSVAAHVHGSKWYTAAIPAYVGGLFILLGIAASKSELRKHVMHAAATIALLVAMGGLGMGLPKIIKHAAGTLPATVPVRPLAWWGQVALSAIMIVFVGLAVRSFIAAKRWRESNEWNSRAA